MGLSKRLAYRRNDALLGLTVLLFALAVVNYYVNFDILAPGIGNGTGSVRADMGPYFLIPILVLAAVQALYVSGVLHLVTRAFYSEKRDFLKALFVSSLLVLLYSIFYTIFPSWGPYLYIVGTFRGTSALDYATLFAWTAVTIASTAYAIKVIYGFKKGEIRTSMLLLISAALLTLVLAMAD